METENSIEDQNEVRIKDPSELAGDLKFMRSVIEKTYRLYDPRWPVIIIWGLIFLTGLPLTQYFLVKPQFKEFIQPMWIILWVIGAFVGIFDGIRCEIREKKTGYVSRLSNQLVTTRCRPSDRTDIAEPNSVNPITSRTAPSSWPVSASSSRSEKKLVMKRRSPSSVSTRSGSSRRA